MFGSKHNDVRAEWKERLGLYSFTQFMQVCFYHFKTGDKKKGLLNLGNWFLFNNRLVVPHQHSIGVCYRSHLTSKCSVDRG